MSPTSKDQPTDALSRILNSEIGAILSDPRESRRRVYAAMADHPDELIREIGEQLRDGVIQPAELTRAGAYRDVILRGIDALDALDVERIAEDVERYEVKRGDLDPGRQPRAEGGDVV